jgi:FixJ family two-component response regulator
MSSPPRKLVAVVDDDPRILESLRELLESAGYEVALHASADSLLTGGVATIDCLITDVGMPVMDGFALRDQVKRLRPELPVLLISGRRDLTDGESALQGADHFFRKPFDGTALLAAIEKALRNKRRE